MSVVRVAMTSDEQEILRVAQNDDVAPIFASGNPVSEQEILRVAQNDDSSPGGTPLPSPLGELLAHSGRDGLVKICGLREPDHARVAVAAGADLIGFVFAPARRRITAETARTCIEAAKAEAGSRKVLAVGVFVNATPDEMNEVAEVAGLDVVQLHGDEEPEMLAKVDRPVTKALRPTPGTSAETVLARAARYTGVTNAPVAFLLDGYAPGSDGGVGVRADWSLAARIARSHPLFLAGGLDAENVEDAIATARPRVVDVSSGVETDGVKDPDKIRAFIHVARRAFATANAAADQG